MRIKMDPEEIEAAHHGICRSPEWPRIEKLHRTNQPRCACCAADQGPGAGVQVHHVFPFHYCIALGRPDLELDQRNRVTLREGEPEKPSQNHHLLVGHLDSFQSSNLNVLEDAAGAYHGLTAEEVRGSESWKQAVTRRLKPLAEMTEQEKQQFAQLMNQRFPEHQDEARLQTKVIAASCMR